MIEQLTKHFGIAPLACGVPRGVETLVVPAADAMDLTYPVKPYWSITGDAVTIIVDQDSKAVSAALMVQTPEGRGVV